jgi:hypothetical protein
MSCGRPLDFGRIAAVIAKDCFTRLCGTNPSRNGFRSCPVSGFSRAGKPGCRLRPRTLRYKGARKSRADRADPLSTHRSMHRKRNGAYPLWDRHPLRSESGRAECNSRKDGRSQHPNLASLRSTDPFAGPDQDWYFWADVTQSPRRSPSLFERLFVQFGAGSNVFGPILRWRFFSQMSWVIIVLGIIGFAVLLWLFHFAT